MAQCAEIFNAHIDWALEQKTWNKSKAHRDLYRQLRLTYPDVPLIYYKQLEIMPLKQSNRQNSKQLPVKNLLLDCVTTNAP